ncbi:MAG: sodium:solute symporter family protein [Myxococcales bacterium]|nr:sodium:solute symporter family protein [Myxococcales bacterium]
MAVAPLVYVVVAAYLLGMLALGLWAARARIESADDFMVAGRRLPWFVIAATLAATEVGGGSSMGVVAKAYGAWGLGAAWYIWAMALTFVVIALLAPRLIESRVRTIPQYFEQRYDRPSALVTASLMIVALVGLTTVQTMATGLLASTLLGIRYGSAALLSGAVVTLYTAFGGMWSVSLTDVAQWILIVVGMACALPFAISRAGGVGRVAAALPPAATDLFAKIGGAEIASLLVIYTTSFSVGQEAMQRLYSAKSGGAARAGALTTAAFYLLFGALPPLLGLVASVLVKQGVIAQAALSRLGDGALLPLLAQSALPPLLCGLLFAGLISATMSSADSNLLGAASIFTNDLWRRDAEPTRALMQRTRAAVIALGVLTTLLAALEPRDLIDLLKLSFGLRAAGPFFPFVFGQLFSRGSRAGALAALLGATALTLALAASKHAPWGLDPMLPGLALGGALYFAGSLLRPDAAR